MVVIITKYIKKRTKNFLKRWFIEPKANIFVGDIDQKRIELIIDYIKKNINDPFTALIIYSTNSVQKYKIVEIGDKEYLKNKKIISGIELLVENAI